MFARPSTYNPLEYDKIPLHFRFHRCPNDQAYSLRVIGTKEQLKKVWEAVRRIAADE